MARTKQTSLKGHSQKTVKQAAKAPKSNVQLAKKPLPNRPGEKKAKVRLAKKPLPLPDGSEKKKTKRGNRARREIRVIQKGFDLLIPRAPFEKEARELFKDHKLEIRIGQDAIDALQEVVEDRTIDLLKNSKLCAVHANRHTVLPKDVQLTKKITKDIPLT